MGAKEETQSLRMEDATPMLLEQPLQTELGGTCLPLTLDKISDLPHSLQNGK